MSGATVASDYVARAAESPHLLGYLGARKQRTSLSIQTKLDVIRYAELNPNVTQNKIASHFGIDRTTVSKVLKKKDSLKTASSDEPRSDVSVPTCSAPRTGDQPETTRIRYRKSPPLLTTSNQDLYDKCESWFVQQKFTTLSKKYQKDIIAYSCLINALPLHIDDCDRIILAKFLMDDGVEWLQRHIARCHSITAG